MDFNTLVNSVSSPAVRQRICGELTFLRHVYAGLVGMGFTHVEIHDEESGRYIDTLSWDGYNGFLSASMACDEDTFVFSKPGNGHSTVTLYAVYGNEPCEVLADWGYSGVEVEEREKIDALIHDISDRIQSGELPHMRWTDLSAPIVVPVPEPEPGYWFVDVHVSMVKTFVVKAKDHHEAWSEGRAELKAWEADGYPFDESQGWELLTGSEDVNDVSKVPVPTTEMMCP